MREDSYRPPVLRNDIGSHDCPDNQTDRAEPDAVDPGLLLRRVRPKREPPLRVVAAGEAEDDARADSEQSSDPCAHQRVSLSANTGVELRDRLIRKRDRTVCAVEQNPQTITDKRPDTAGAAHGWSIDAAHANSRAGIERWRRYVRRLSPEGRREQRGRDYQSRGSHAPTLPLYALADNTSVNVGRVGLRLTAKSYLRILRANRGNYSGKL